MKARAYLAVMALAVLVPIILFSAIALSMLMQAERATALRSLQETARATTLAVDRELSIAEARAQVLATATSLVDGDFKAFHERASLANRGGKSWTVLFDESGRQLVNTLVPYGTELPRRGHPEYGHEVLRTGAMRVSNLLDGTVAGGKVLAIEVPVVLDGGRQRYVLNQAFSPADLDAALRRNEVPANYIIGIFDRKGISIARSQRASELVGKPVRKELFDSSRSATEGVLQHDTRENIRVYDAFKRSALSGWTVAVGVPVDVIEASARRAVMVASMGLMAAIICALALALYFSRRMALSIESAVTSAAALGRGEAPQQFASGVLEFDRLHAALVAAGGILQQERESRGVVEQERARLFTSEQEARLLAENQNRAKDEFLAMLSHELRNPLAAISNSIALMEHPAVPADIAARARNIIKRQSRHLAHIVDDLLDLGRLMNGKVALVRQRLDLAEAVRDCVQSMQTTGRIDQHRLQLQATPAWVDADPTRIEQVISNLVSNALKYTPPGGSITVDVGALGDSAVLTVSDTGIGMPPELVERVFDVFVQGAGALDRSQGGLGIGLALVRQLVVLHAGDVSAASPGPDQGSTFTVRLPLSGTGTMAASPHSDQPDATTPATPS
ncbi:sensor histidine kinase [Noviherbaspirillum suwonense]|nr:sensor histidine kinase [Noviherbaspirillum suwonense]